jgi:hypothetical protein
MKAEFKTLTPLDAAMLLETNKSNRNIRAAKVDQYCRDMRAGKFVTTHQGIAVYDNGRLADGQHRLMAMVKTGIPCRVLFVSGIPFEENHILAIDSGTARSVTDSSSISGRKVSCSDKSLIRWLAGCKGGKLQSIVIKMTHSEVISAAADFSEQLAMINRVMKSNRKGVTIAPVKAAMCISWDDGVDMSIIEGFAYFMYSGLSNQMFNGEYIKLRDGLMTATTSGNTSGQVFSRVIALLKKTQIKTFG